MDLIALLVLNSKPSDSSTLILCASPPDWWVWHFKKQKCHQRGLVETMPITRASQFRFVDKVRRKLWKRSHILDLIVFHWFHCLLHWVERCIWADEDELNYIFSKRVRWRIAEGGGNCCTIDVGGGFTCCGGKSATSLSLALPDGLKLGYLKTNNDTVGLKICMISFKFR